MRRLHRAYERHAHTLLHNADTKPVEIAKQVDGPVKIVWSREEDVQHDMYRPYFYDRLQAGLDADGTPVAWTHRICGSSIIARWAPPAFKDGFDFDTVDGAVEPPYSFPNMRVEYVRHEPPGIPTAFWRSVGPSHNVFVVESFIDELAAAAKKDPVDYRRALLGKSPRALAVLNLAAEKAGWDRLCRKGPAAGQGDFLHAARRRRAGRQACRVLPFCRLQSVVGPRG